MKLSLFRSSILAKDGIPVTFSMMKKLSLILSAVALLAVNAFAGAFPDISLNDLKKAVAAKDVTIIDVNGTKSYSEGHIPGSIDYTANKADIASKLPADKGALVVAYCGSEKCSAYAQAAQAAKDLGYTNVKHFAPGLKGWKAAGEPLQAAK
jgi:rhodanese-related sulfurtransferase